MKTSLTVDASVIIASLVPMDKEYAVSRRFISMIKSVQSRVTMPLITFFEILQVYFRFCNDREKTDAIYKEMIDWNVEGTLQLINLEASFLTYFAANHDLFPLKTSDAVLALTAHRLKQPLISWDKKLLQHAKKHVKAMTPAEFLKAPMMK